ncbi:GerAB/ArcD/ProY family transporter [Peribacillus deserti]|uniref:Uncharacterized protein n=1 Tax=Peribacillus deserti TaxID=673318 RepID=A0A2N5M4C8_9BACI|nr:GerAB/ArcD/ProY family transporter [Peribacillus deserti]PLT29123.1 hypothetical protein CUU66_15010 [Peribacillus deserti]
MLNNRYFYYLLILNGLVNSVNFVPRILVNKNGSLIAIFVAVVIGTLMIIFTTKAMQSFPGKELPEILEPLFPKFINKGMILFFSLHWYLFGAITLVSLVDITHRFITPDVNRLMLAFGLLALVIFACQVESYSVLVSIETILIVNIPIFLYFIIKIFSNEFFSWDTIREVVTDAADMPHYTAIAAASFIFTGYINLVVFNRLFKDLKVKKIWIIAISGLLLLLAAYLIPIGINGIEGVKHQVYPWLTTADSNRIVFFIIERLLFIYYLFYITVAVAATVLYWHVGLRLLQTSFFKKTGKKFNIKNLLLLLIFVAGTFFLIQLDQFNFMKITDWFIRVRLISEVLLLLMLFYAVRRAKKA